MGIEVVEHAVVDAPPDAVWALLADVRGVVECVPGATLGALRDDGRYDASIGVKFGMIPLRFTGVARVGYDEPTRTVSISAQGRDASRTTKVAGDVVVTVVDGSPGTRLAVRGTFDFAGPAAQVAQTGARAVAGSILRAFADCIRGRAAHEGGRS